MTIASFKAFSFQVFCVIMYILSVFMVILHFSCCITGLFFLFSKSVYLFYANFCVTIIGT